MFTKKIWDKVLSPGEEVKFEFSLGEKYLSYFKYGWVSFGFLFLILGLIFLGKPSSLFKIFGLVLILVGATLIAIGFLGAWYLKRANNFAFTQKRILILRGWLSTQLVSIDYDKITNIKVEQNFFEKLVFNTGKLIIDTAGTDLPEVILTNIENPYQIKKKLDEARDLNKKSFSL